MLCKTPEVVERGRNRPLFAQAVAETPIVGHLDGDAANGIKEGLVFGTRAYETTFNRSFGNTEAAGSEPVLELSNLLFPAKTASV